MDVDCQIVVGVLVFLALVWMFLETHYFLQMFSTMFVSKLIKKGISVFEQTSYYGICSTTDVDVFFDHMNNSRYLRDLDFARMDFYIRSRLANKILQSGGLALVGSNLVIYKRPIRPLTAYSITSKIVYWDKKSIFMEHRFITSSDSVVSTIIFSQQCFINCEADVILQKLQEPEAPVEKPPMPPEVARMLQIITETSSLNKNTTEVDVTSLPTKDDANASGKIPSQEGLCDIVTNRESVRRNRESITDGDSKLNPSQEGLCDILTNRESVRNRESITNGDTKLNPSQEGLCDIVTNRESVRNRESITDGDSKLNPSQEGLCDIVTNRESVRNRESITNGDSKLNPSQEGLCDIVTNRESVGNRESITDGDSKLNPSPEGLGDIVTNRESVRNRESITD